MNKKVKILVVAVALAVVLCAVSGVVYKEFFTVKPIEVKETVPVSQTQLEDTSKTHVIALQQIGAGPVMANVAYSY